MQKRGGKLPTRGVLLIVLALTFVHVALAVIVQRASSTYVGSKMATDCVLDVTKNWEYYPVFLSAALYIWVLYPYALWRLRRVEDAMGVTQELRRVLMASIIILFVYAGVVICTSSSQ